MENSEPRSKKKSKSKRKMNTEPVNEPAIEPVKAKVEVVPLDPNKIPPCVGYFPSGFDPVKQPGSNGIQVYQNQNKPGKKRTELVVSPAGCSVEFVGSNYKSEVAAGHLSSYALGVFDKEAKTLKVMEICGNKILRLEPRVRGLEYMEPPPTETVEDGWSLEEYNERRDKLHFTLSTKRTTEMIKKRAEIRRDEEEPEAKQNLDEKMKNVEVKELAIANTDAHLTRQIPPYNDSATTPQEAYVLDKIILAGEWNYLQAIYYGLQKGEDFSGYPIFIRNRIDRLKKIEDENEKQKLASILEFITHLVNFKDQHSMDGVSSSKHHKIPHILNHRFNTMFNVSESRRLPTEKINLLHSYVMVLTLFSDKFMTDYTDISKDLRISKISTKQIYQHLGCKFTRQNGAFYATLPVPLTFPKLKSNKRPKKN